MIWPLLLGTYSPHSRYLVFIFFFFSGGWRTSQTWELQKHLFIGSFVSVVNGCKPEMAKEIRYDLQRTIRCMNSEYAERGFAHRTLTPEEKERKNDITILSELILDAYKRLHERLQHLKAKLTEEGKAQEKAQNKMVSKDIKNLKSYTEYKAVREFYHDMPKTVLARASNNIEDYVQAIYYLEQAIFDKGIFHGNEECHDEGTFISLSAMHRDLIEAYSQIGLYDEVKGLYMLDTAQSQITLVKQKRAEYLADGKTDDLSLISTIISNAERQNGENSKPDVDQMVEVITRLRIDGAVGESLQTAEYMTRTSVDDRFKELALAAAMELGDWNLVEHKIAGFRERGSTNKLSFDLEYNSLIFDLYKKLGARQNVRSSIDESIENQIEQLYKDFPISDGNSKQNRLCKHSILQKHMVRDAELLHIWIKKRPSLPSALADKVYHDWDSRRSLQSLKDQEMIIEKQSIMLRMIHSQAIVKDKIEIRNAASNLAAETYLIRSKLCSLMGKHNDAVRNLHLSREWNVSLEFGWEISFEEAKQRLRITAIDKDSYCSKNDSMKANQLLTELCANCSGSDNLSTYQKEHWAKCHILLARISNRYDLGSLNFGQYNETRDLMSHLNSAYNKRTKMNLDRAILLADKTLKNGSLCMAHYHFGMFQEKVFRHDEKFMRWKKIWIKGFGEMRSLETDAVDTSSLGMATRSDYLKNCSDGLRDAINAITSYKQCILHGDSHSQVCLFKILGLAFDVADTVGKGWKNKPHESTVLGGLSETRFFKSFQNAFLDLPSENGIFVLTQLLGRVDHKCTALVDAITEIITDLVHKFPHQVMWHLLDLFRRYDDVANNLKRDVRVKLR